MGRGKEVPDRLHDPEFREHYEAFVKVFVSAHRQDRFLLRPREGLDSICHDLREVLRPNLALMVSTSLRSEMLASELTRRSSSEFGIVLSRWGGDDRPEGLAHDLITELDHTRGGAGISLVPGEWLYLRGEYPDSVDDRFVLIANDAARAEFRRWLEVSTKAR